MSYHDIKINHKRKNAYDGNMFSQLGYSLTNGLFSFMIIKIILIKILIPTPSTSLLPFFIILLIL